MYHADWCICELLLLLLLLCRRAHDVDNDAKRVTTTDLRSTLLMSLRPRLRYDVILQTLSHRSLVACEHQTRTTRVYSCSLGASLMQHVALHFAPHSFFFSQPSICIDGWLYGMRMTSVTFRCCLKTIPHIIILSSRHESDIPSLYTWTPSFIILVWGHHPPLRRIVFACLQNCYSSCISCSRSAIWFTLRYDSINSNLMN